MKHSIYTIDQLKEVTRGESIDTVTGDWQGSVTLHFESGRAVTFSASADVAYGSATAELDAEFEDGEPDPTKRGPENPGFKAQLPARKEDP